MTERKCWCCDATPTPTRGVWLHQRCSVHDTGEHVLSCADCWRDYCAWVREQQRREEYHDEGLCEPPYVRLTPETDAAW